MLLDEGRHVAIGLLGDPKSFRPLPFLDIIRDFGNPTSIRDSQ